MATAIEEMNQNIGEIGKFVKERTDSLTGDVKLLKEESERMRSDVVALQERLRERRRSMVARADEAESSIRVTAGRFAGYSPLDVGIMRAVAYNHRGDPDAPHARAWIEQLGEAARSMVADLTANDVDRHFQSIERRLREAYVQKSLPGTLAKDPELQYRQVVMPMLTHLRDIAVRAAMDSTTAGVGDELVPHPGACRALDGRQPPDPGAALIPMFPMPSQPFDIPTQLGNVNFFPGAENTRDHRHRAVHRQGYSHRTRAGRPGPLQLRARRGQRPALPAR